MAPWKMQESRVHTVAQTGAVLGATWCLDTPGVLMQEPGEGDGELPGCRAHSIELACSVQERAGERPPEH